MAGLLVVSQYVLRHGILSSISGPTSHSFTNHHVGAESMAHARVQLGRHRGRLVDCTMGPVRSLVVIESRSSIP
eukprot:scaffold6898_cov149-Amphora_coffeaeformis.AAC.4